MELQLNETRAAAGTLTQRTAELQAARSANALKSDLADRFVSTFTLSEEERKALAVGELTDEFFAALERVHSICNAGRLLVRSGAAQQVGLDVLDRMGEVADAAYERITAHAQDAFRGMQGESSEPPRLLCLALQLLGRERPALVKYCVDEVQQARKQALVTAFVRALTTAGPKGVPQAMDEAASDPVRYVGDMLAWCHQALASETELVRSLFGAQVEPAPVVGGMLATCCRPLRSRLDGVLKGPNLDLVLAHDLRSLLQFYRVTLSAYVDAECDFGALLAEYQLQFRSLFDALVGAAAQEAANVQTVHPDLGAPSLLHRAVYHLSRIAETFETSLLPPEERTADALLLPLVDPLVNMCVRTAGNLSPELGAVFLINCFVLLRNVFEPKQAFAADLVRDLNARIDEAVARVADSEGQSLLTRSQLLPSLRALSNADQAAPLKDSILSMPGLDARSLGENLKTLESIVFGAGDLVLAMGAAEKIQDETVRLKVKALVVDTLVEAYQKFHSIVHDPSNNYPDAIQIVRYTPEQFKSLLEN